MNIFFGNFQILDGAAISIVLLGIFLSFFVFFKTEEVLFVGGPQLQELT